MTNHIFISVISLFFLTLSAQAWELSVKNEEGKPPVVWAGNQQPQGEVDVYLLWLDIDEEPQNWFQSWTAEQGWQPNIQAVFNQAVEINAFDSIPITQLTPQCPTEHRCFLALLALEPGSDALDLAAWQDAAVMPLSVQAAYERLPAQTFFLNPDEGNTGIGGVPFMDATTGGVRPPATLSPAPETSDDRVNDGDSDSAATTEKPDIFRLLDNNTLLYVNGQAERLQMIDVSDLSQPQLKASLALSASPRELYVLNDLYILLQNKDYKTSEFSVVKQNAEGELAVVDTQAISGSLYESRRRNDRIYSVARAAAEVDGCCFDYATLDINVVQIDALGNLDSIDNTQIRGYDPKIAVFSDHLVIANRDPNTYPDSLVQVFDLSNANEPLVDLGTVRVPGYVPSEFHVDVRDQQLRIVYGPENREAGSNLGIYDLTQEGLPLLGEVRNIAPGEALFATRFHEDKAYIVTFERTDPLWVIGLSDPSNPEILGELIVPGWSEKLFFYDDRLFAVGIDDQPSASEGETERWYRRVAMSLFDVSDPTKPGVLDRFTPLTGTVNYSYSPALDDERALLLNWNRSFAALPINTWYSNMGNMNNLQMVDFSQDKFLDLGLLELSVPAQRSLILGDNNIGVMADQRFITAQWSDTDKPHVLGELELSRNLGWLDKQADNLWSAGYGQNGYRYVYRYTVDDVELPAQSWTLAGNFYQVANTDTHALFYQHSPMSVQRLDYNTQSLSELQNIEPQTPPDDNLTVADRDVVVDKWYQRSDLMADDTGFYLGEQRPVSFEVPQPVLLGEDEPATDAGLVKPYVHYSAEWRLRSWQWQDGKAVEQASRAIPGKPLALTQDGRLITVERTQKGSRLELVALRGIWTQVVQRLDLDCNINALHTQADGFYASCTPDYYYYYPTLDDGTAAPVQTRILHLVLDGQLRIEREWKVDGQRNLLASNQGIIMLAPDYYYGYYPYYPIEPGIATDDVAARSLSVAPDLYWEQGQCEVFALNAELQSIAKLETCPAAQNVALLPEKAYFTKGFAGIQSINW